MEEKRMHSCSEGKEVILAEFMLGRCQSGFYVMDLKAEKIRKTPIATLLNEIGLGSAVRLGPLIYNFGGDTKADYDYFRGSDHHIHLGASALFLSKSHALSLLNQCDDEDECDEDECDPSGSKSESIRWMSAPVMNHRRMALSCASLGGKIYALGGSATELCIGEEFTPDAGEWKPLPQPPTDLPVERFCVSSPVIPDENNQRLLVHFDNARALYAYYPATETWDCLAHNFFTWWPATALADGVLYSHTGTMLSRDCITAYDILTKSWLKVVYSAYFPISICVSEFTDMLHLGKDMFCLATSYPFSVEGKASKGKAFKCNIQFVKFRVKRTTPTEVLVTPVAVNCFSLKRHMEPIRFLVL